MSDDPVYLDLRPPLARLVLNRPEKRNALSEAMWLAIPGLVDEAAETTDVKVLLLSGAGGTFAAGADIGEFERVYRTRESGAAYSAAIAAAMASVAGCPKPTIAAIEGACVGGGCGLALACDLRFADETAMFGITPGKLGLAYTLADTKRLVDAVGAARAKDILFTGRLLPAEEAKEAGLVDFLAPAGELASKVDEYAAGVCAASQYSVRTSKQFIEKIRGGAVDDDRQTRELFLSAFEGEDFREGYVAFLDKRKPRFTYR